jgi:hypothetical protein
MGYCLMSNHVRLVLVPRRAESLGLALKHAHGRYASYWNAAYHSSGHVWQGRYYSCPLDEPHLWEALCYTELNPVRRPGGRVRILDVVQCRRPLRSSARLWVAGSGTVAVTLDCGQLASISEGKGECVRTSRDLSVDAHGTPARDCGVRARIGTVNTATLGAAKS